MSSVCLLKRSQESNGYKRDTVLVLNIRRNADSLSKSIDSETEYWVDMGGSKGHSYDSASIERMTKFGQELGNIGGNTRMISFLSRKVVFTSFI